MRKKRIQNAEKSFKWSLFTVAVIYTLIFLFTSCVTQKQRERILKDCPVNSFEKSKDSTWTKETVKIDTFYLSREGAIRYLPSPCATLCDSLGNLKPIKIVTKKNGVKQVLESQGNTLVQRCDIDSLMQVNSTLTKEVNRLIEKEKETQVHSNCKLEHLSKFDSFFIITGRISLVLLLLIAIVLVLKRWAKGWLPF